MLVIKTSRFASPGFTLVELLMAMLIMTVGLLGLLQAVCVAMEHKTRNRLREEAVQIADEQMHDFRRIAFTDITAKNLSAVITRTLGGSQKNFTVTRDSQVMGTNTKRLKVAVGWNFKAAAATHEIYTIKNNR